MRVSQPALLLGPLFFCGGLALLAACAEGAKADDVLNTSDIDSGKTEEEGGKVKLPDNPDPDPDPGDPDGGGKKDGGSSGTTSSGASAACVAALNNAKWDFESGVQGWTSAISDGVTQSQAPGWPFNPWTHGATTYKTTCSTGSCWAGERTQNYGQCARGEIVSPTVDLNACKGASIYLTFKHAYAFWTDGTNADGAIVEVNNGTSWQIPSGTYPGTVKIRESMGIYNCVSNAFHTDNQPGFTGKQETTQTFEVKIPDAMLTTNTRVRFAMAGGVSFGSSSVGDSRTNTDFGWRIDDVAFIAK
jgi:hypothetical protein